MGLSPVGAATGVAHCVWLCSGEKNGRLPNIAGNCVVLRAKGLEFNDKMGQRPIFSRFILVF